MHRTGPRSGSTEGFKRILCAIGRVECRMGNEMADDEQQVKLTINADDYAAANRLHSLRYSMRAAPLAFWLGVLAIFAFFLALRRFFALPLLQLFGGSAVLGLCGLLAARAR